MTNLCGEEKRYAEGALYLDKRDILCYNAINRREVIP
jgi:hypothetical protein